MFALGIRYLNGWSMAAADGARKKRAEWPPHPDRVFMALAAAWFETGQDAAEGRALRWLESLPPPAIAASDATDRTAVVSYVPVNDTQRKKLPVGRDLDKLKNAGLTLIPGHRPRQPRGFPIAIPRDPTVHLMWPEAKLGGYQAALEQLAAKVTHVGHSASFVQAWLEARPPRPTWIPAIGAMPKRLRVTNPGRLEFLETRMNRAAPMRPVPGRWQGYGRPREDSTPKVPGSVFDSRLLVLGISGKRVSLPATLKLTTALRGLLMKACPEQPPPEWFSGHRPDGTPTSEPHLALAPLPFVGAQHADGRIMGLAVVLPAKLDPQEAGGCLHPILHDRETGLPREHRLFGGQWFECRLQLETRERPPMNLDGRSWTRPSRVWATVTPVVLNRHFDGKNKWDQAAESVKDMCEHIGLPRPREVLIHPVSRVEGVPTAREFPRLVRKSDGGRRSHNHAVIVFDEPVRGPVLVGAGRFRGYGWCRPMNERGDERP